MRVVGLTGGIASGKSSVGRILTKCLGVPVIDADQASRTVMMPGECAYEDVVTRFGPRVCMDNGQINRAYLRDLITRDNQAKRALESITHPAIRLNISRQLTALAEAGHQIAVVEAALLVETGSWRQYQGLVVVSCERETQIVRVMARDSQTRKQAERILDSQFPLEKKEEVASVVIHNNGSLSDLQKATLVGWKNLLNTE